MENLKRVEKNVVDAGAAERSTVVPVHESKDITNSYIYFRNYESACPFDEYIAKKKCVEFGKELLPTALDDAAEQKVVNAIYTEACEILTEARPARRKIKYEFQDFGNGKVTEIYKLLASDADEAQAKESEYDKIEKNFEKQQYETQTKKLQYVDNKIFHVLVVNGIIKKRDRDFGEIMDDIIKDAMTELEVGDTVGN